jgi:CTP synthase
MRQFQFQVGADNFFLIHVSLIPVVGSVGEQKTKPTQASVRNLRGAGLMPDLIACRSSKAISDEIKSKISMFCHVPPESVVAVHDCNSVYHVPLLLLQQGILPVLQKKLKFTAPVSIQDSALLKKWTKLTKRQERLHEQVKIVLVGKYTQLHDSYISVMKSLEHAALSCNRKLHLEWLEAEELEPSFKESYPVKFHEAWKSLVAAQ